jgi:hypothetical protein
MPTIPQFLVEEQLNARSGTPALTPAARIFGDSEVSLGAAGVLGGAIAGLGKDMSQAGGFIAQGEELQARTVYADRVLAAQGRVLDRLPILNAEVDKQKQDPNYATLAGRVLSEGKRVIDEGGYGLDPKAREIYDKSIRERLVILHQNALGEQSGRRDEVARQTTERKFLAAEDAYVNAPTNAARGMVLADLTEFTDMMVKSGVVRGADIEQRIDKMTRGVTQTQWQRQMRADAQGTLRALYAMNQGQPAPEGMPAVQPDMLPRLIDEAAGLQDRIVAKVEHDERVADYRAAKVAQDRTIYYRQQLSQMDQTPDSLEKARQLLTLANTSEEIRVLGAAGHQEVTGILRGFMNTIQGRQAERDNSEVETLLRVSIATAQTPQDLVRAERDYYRLAPGNLKPETQTTLLNMISERRDKQSPANRVKYREGVEHIQRAEVVPLGAARDPQNAAYMQRVMTSKLRDALDQYDRDYRAQLTEYGVEVADGNALNLADRARTMYFPSSFNDLPLELREAKTIEAARFHLQKLAQQGAPSYSLQAWEKAWRDKQQAPTVPQDAGKQPLIPGPTPTRPVSQ